MVKSSLKTRHEIAYQAFRVGLGMGSRLPLGLTRSIGKHLGVVALAIGTRDRRRARAHLRIAFPDLQERQVRRLLRGFARHVGSIAAEVAWLWRATPQQVMALCTIEGTEHFRAALDVGRGVILVTGHCGNWEILNARLCAAGIPMSAAVRSIYDPRLDRISGTLRSRFGLEVVPRGVDAGRQLTAALNRNRVVGYSSAGVTTTPTTWWCTLLSNPRKMVVSGTWSQS
jgi:KDO2-lipid IV(A) lauroyltransferase